MDDYNWDDWDAQTSEYLNSGDYSGPAFTTGDGQTWGGNYNAPNLEQPQSPLEQQQSGSPLGGMYGSDIENTTTPWNQAAPQTSNWLQDSAQSLKDLFSSSKNNGSTNNFLKTLAGLGGAYMENKSNKQMASQIPQTINANRQFTSPYDISSTGGTMMGGTSMRDAAQQQFVQANNRLNDFRSNPNSDAGYKAQSDQLVEEIRRAAAARGTRFNPEATAPSRLAALGKLQMQYDQNYQTDRNSWDTRAGANISPNGQGLSDLIAAIKYGAQQNSPYMSALGKTLNTNSYENNPQIQELLQAIRGR
jgi:hypothetical protein